MIFNFFKSNREKQLEQELQIAQQTIEKLMKQIVQLEELYKPNIDIKRFQIDGLEESQIPVWAKETQNAYPTKK